MKRCANMLPSTVELNLVLVLFLCFTSCVVCDKAESSDQKQTDLFKSIVLPPNISPVQRKSVVVTDTRESLSKDQHVDAGHDILVAASGAAVPKSASYQRWRPQFSRQGEYSPGNAYDVDNERVAPPSHRTGPGESPYIITEARLKTIRSRFLYWYFDQGGDDAFGKRRKRSDAIGDYQKDIHASSPQIHKNFNFQLPFFGFRFNYTRVSMHGYLEFSDPPEHYTYPLSFPNQDWPKKNDPAFIGIFYSKCRIGSIRPSDIDQRIPGVYFRMERDLMLRTDQMGVEMRERLMWDIREGVVGADTFIPKHSVIITWKNVSFAGGIDNSLYKTNTFQMVLATDEVFTYAIFNYADIQWTSHTEAGGDTTGGEGGTPAFIGFNAGNGTRSAEYKPYSQTSAIRDLSGRGWANGFPGRHIFRIDENIILGTCNKDIAGANLQLTFAPESGNMLGGTVVNITGPCFLPEMKIRCRFDTEDVMGTVVDTNRAICIQPFVMAEGYVLFGIAIGEGAYNWKGKYFIETPATATERITFESEAVHETYPEEIKISWNKYNLTSNLAASVRISLWGYRETTILPELVYIDMIEEGIANTGSYTIVPSNFKSRNNYLTNDVRFGFVHMNLTNPTQYQGLTISPVLWSRPIPLGWYFAPQWERLYGSNWPSQQCDQWLMNDRYLKNFAADIAPCPCTLNHALADKGRFMPDFDCDIDRNPSCRYNKGARHCVKTGSPSLEGSEQQCCYDKNNYLMLSYDQKWGSRPRRSHNFGYLPWNEANKVPTLSQWYHDMSPFYFCCLWQEEQAVGCETFRFERRPSQDCVAYQSPYVATVFGDPHIITFDDLEYTFNGKGEFVLVHADSNKLKLDIQARFEQLPDNIYGEVRATQLTAVAARDNSSAIIEVRLRPLHAQWRYRLDVFADGKRVFFDRPSFRTQHFPRVTVYQPSYILNQSQIIVMFESGVGVEVVENKGFMTTRVYMPWKFINQTRGLLGTWSFDPNDDLTRPDGTISAITTTNLNSFENIHRDFAVYWLLEDREDSAKGSSLFLREYRRTASYYANRTYEPEWRTMPEQIIPANRSQDIAMANALCGDSYQCKFDYAVSLNRDLAFYTLLYKDTFSTIKSVAKQRVITCGILETPRFGRKSNFFFVPGTKVTFECNQDFVLIGDQRRTCTPEGIWDVPLYGYTECLSYVEYDFRQIFIATMAVVAVVLPLLIILLCVIAFIVRKMRGEGSSASWRYVADAGRRLSATKHETIPLKSAANLIDADSGIGITKKVNNDSSPDSNPRHSVKDEPDWKYDGVYHTHEPLPGRPLTEFPKDKIWDFKDEDVFSSRANVSTDPPSPDVTTALPSHGSSNPKRNSGILKKPPPLNSQGSSSVDTQSPATSSQSANSPVTASPATSSPLPVSPVPSSPAQFSDESSPQSSPQSPVSNDILVYSQSSKKKEKPVKIKVPNGSSIVTQV